MRGDYRVCLSLSITMMVSCCNIILLSSVVLLSLAVQQSNVFNSSASITSSSSSSSSLSPLPTQLMDGKHNTLHIASSSPPGELL